MPLLRGFPLYDGDRLSPMIFNLFGTNTWNLGALHEPWGESASLYEFVRSSDGEKKLPDEPVIKPNEIGWAPGAMDGLIGHHFGVGEQTDINERIQRVARAIERLLEDPTDRRLRELYKEVLADYVLPIADDLATEITTRLLYVKDYRRRLRDLGKYFATKAPTREAAKLGILLLGIAGSEADVEVLRTLAGHGEFTLFAVVAVGNLHPESDRVIWEIAKRVEGWGRIHAVERLADTRNEAIQRWLLREGFRNNIMDNYLAAIAARAGELHKALAGPDVDRELMDGAARIIMAMWEGGPADTLVDYEYSASAIPAYLRHVSHNDALGFEHLFCACELKRFVEQQETWEKLRSQGWTGQLRDEVRRSCETLISRPGWKQQIEQGLQSPDREVFFNADRGAQEFGINTWQIHFDRVKNDPIGSQAWYRLLAQTDDSTIDEVLAFAESALPLIEIATGPEDVLGTGPKYEAHRALDWLLQELKRFPQRGWNLLKAGLRSPVTRNRNLALAALMNWPRETWPAEALGMIRNAHALEPNGDAKKWLAEAMRSQ